MSRTDTVGTADAPDPDSHHGLPATEPGASRYPGELAALGDRFPAADGARALAAFGVLLTHVGLLSGFNFAHPAIGAYFARAEVGVSIFFVLSGFLLYRPFAVRRFAGHPPGETGKYARRRLLRIFPAYWVALTIVAFVLRAPPFVEPHSIVAHYLLLQIYDPNQVVFGPIDQAWSLATEVSFYVFLPIWAWLLARRTRPPEQQLKVEVGTLAALWTGCIALNLAVIAMGVSGPRFGQLGTWLPFRIHEFVLGMATRGRQRLVASPPPGAPPVVVGHPAHPHLLGRERSCCSGRWRRRWASRSAWSSAPSGRSRCGCSTR